MKYLKIGELSKQTGLTVQTLRFYETQGIIDNEYRSKSGYRYYHPKAILVLRLVQHYKEMNFTLKEISGLLGNFGTEAKCIDIRELVKKKLKEIETEISSLQSAKNVLQNRVAICDSCDKNINCCMLKECLSSINSN